MTRQPERKKDPDPLKEVIDKLGEALNYMDERPLMARTRIIESIELLESQMTTTDTVRKYRGRML